MYSPAVLDLFARSRTSSTRPGCSTPGCCPARAAGRRHPRGRAGVRRAPPGRERLGLALPRATGTSPRPCTAARAWASAWPAPPGTTRVMCPSYQATRDEQDSTRGRARVLQEMVNGGLVTGGWRAPEVREALDLCLSCKACSSECPAGVDMAAYKAEVLHQAYRGRLPPAQPLRARPAAALGAAGRGPGLPAPGQRRPGLRRAWAGLARLAAGIDPRRSLPPFAPQSFRAWYTPPPASGAAPARRGRPAVMLLIDTFTDYFDPGIGRAALAVLADAGYDVLIPDRPTCCAITWISTGQLGRGPARSWAARWPSWPRRWRPGSRSSAWSRPARPCSAPTPIDLLGTPGGRGAGRARSGRWRAAGRHPGLDAAAAGRHGRRGAAALPPQRGHGLGRRRGPARARRAPG